MSNPLLEIPPFGKVRRVHGLEHATIHILSRRVRHVSFSGLSIPYGFWLVGTVEPEEVSYAANEALRRLQAGEGNLAVHPRCGTNLAVGGLLTGVTSLFASFSFDPKEYWLEKLPRVIAAATIAMIFAGPLGFAVQENITTSPDAANLSLGKITRLNPTLYFVEVH
jgi:hypothetical protein